MSDDVIQFPQVTGRPRKRATAPLPAVTQADFNSDDEVTNLEALKSRMSQMLARPDISERDFATLNKDYRKVMVELTEARDRAEASKLGRRGSKVAGGRSFDGDI